MANNTRAIKIIVILVVALLIIGIIWLNFDQIKKLFAPKTAVDTGSSNIGITYTYPTVFNNPQNYHYLRPKSGGGLTSDMVDNYLIDLSAKTWAAFSTSTLLIDLRGNNAARTSASNAAVSTLVSKGVTVLTN